MSITKISLDDVDIIRKCRVQTRNFYVSSDVEHFTLGAKACFLADRRKNEINFGVSKQELRVSNRDLVCGWLGTVNGGS